MPDLSSRERMLRALSLLETDHVPCCFMNFKALRQRLNDDVYELVKAERAMGLDSTLVFPNPLGPRPPEHPDFRGLPFRFHPEIGTKEWREEVPGGSDILHKEYSTPAGTLTTSVRLSDDWPYGDHIPFSDNYQVPRAVKPLITEPGDLDALQYFLMPPDEQDIARFEAEAQEAHAFVHEHRVLLTGALGIGMDLAAHLCTIRELMVLAMERPAFVMDLLEMIHVWNRQRMAVMLSAPIDLFIRTAFYEGVDFVTPRFYRDAVLPRLRSEVDLAHERGAKFGLVCTSGAEPLLDFYLEAGIDVLIGIDPVMGTYTDMPVFKEKLGSRACLWGGVSSSVTVERGTEEEIRLAVRQAIETLGPGGFILSPVDSVLVDVPRTWRNVDLFIDEWRRHW